MPGRIVGETIDKDGKPGYVLTFQTREQHIRREKATSNICSNEALVALRTAVFLSTVGRKGLREMAKQSLIKTNYMKNRFIDAGFKVLNINNIFKEFVVEFDIDVKKISEKLFKNKIFGGIDLGMFYPSMKNYLLVAVTEMRTKEEIDKYIEILKSI